MQRNTGALVAMTLVFQLGLTVAAPIAVGAIGGYWLDGRANTRPLFTLIGIFLGLAGGLFGAYQLVVTAFKAERQPPERD